jgi:phage terminase large subunit-like protein
MTSATNSSTEPCPSLLLSAAAVLGAVRLARERPDHFLELCLSDPTGRPLRQAAVHRQLQAFLTAHRKALVELPRDHGKSVQVCGRVLWELGRSPGLRVKLVCASRRMAAERTRFLREAVASGDGALRLVFPDLRPGRPWSAEEFGVPRPAEVIGPSVAAFGIAAASTGARADLLVCDDVVDVKCLLHRGQRERVIELFHGNLMNLLEPDGRFWGLFTPWHADDLNARLTANPAYAHFRRAVGPELEPVWPEKWPAARLAERRAEVGAAAFARGYRLVPIVEGEQAIRPEWVKVWDDELPRGAFEAVVLAVDPAVSAKRTADASALVVLGRVGNEVRCLEAAARRLAAPDLVEAIADCDGRWGPEVILFESNAAFAAVKDLLVRHARYGPRVLGVPQSKNKAARVAAFSVPVQNGWFRLKGDGSGGVDAGQRELHEEMTTFPVGRHDDLLDAAATGTAHLLNRREPRIWV